MKNLRDFSEMNVLVIGDIMLDQYFYGSVNRISPEAPVPVLNLESSELKAGGAANVALNINAMGAKAILLSSCGSDLSGAKLIETLNDNAIETENIIQVEDEITTVKTRMIAGGQHIMRLDEEKLSDINAVVEDKIISRLRSIIQNANISAILLEDYNKGLLTSSLIKEIRNIAFENEILISVDPKYHHFREYIEFNLLKPNLREVNQLLNEEFQPILEDLNEAASKLKALLNYECLMITLGDSGVFIDDGQNTEIVPTQSLDVVDVCGAGDAVISIATLCLAAGFSLKETAEWANKAGAVVCSHLGVSAVSRDELLS